MQVWRNATTIMGVIWSSLQIFCVYCCCPKSSIQSLVTSIIKRPSCGPCCSCLHHQQPLSPTCQSPSHPKFKPPSPPDQPKLSPPAGSPVASSETLFGEKVHVPPSTSGSSSSGGAHSGTPQVAVKPWSPPLPPHPLLSSSTPPHAGDEFSRFQHYSAA